MITGIWFGCGSSREIQILALSTGTAVVRCTYVGHLGLGVFTDVPRLDGLGPKTPIGLLNLNVGKS
jgi:hypothetical protein